MTRYTNRVVIISGGAHGIGAACAHRIAQEQGKVVLLDTDEEAIFKVGKEIALGGGTAFGIPCDISQANQIESAYEQIMHTYGEVHALVNNAGVHRYDHFLEMEMNDFDWVMNTNVRGTLMMTQTFLPHLKDTQGSVVNIASTAGLGNHAYSVAYAASSGALISATKALTNEFAKEGVNFNVVCPGAVTTQMWSNSFSHLPTDFEPRLLVKAAPFAKKAQTAEDVAGLVAFLASSEGKHLNGSVIVSDGGSMA
jgi:3-oxoacyl-[acyl-carrier protein] reductase